MKPGVCPSWMQINWQPLDSPILSNSQHEKSSQEPTRSHDVGGSHFELRTNSVQEHKVLFIVFLVFDMFMSYYSAPIFNVF